MGDHRPSGLRSSYRSAEVAASIFSASVVPQPIHVKPMDRGVGRVSRDDAHFVRFRECDSRQTPSKPTTMGTEGSGQRMYRRHGGACLRRAMFSTRNASPQSAAPPPRSLPAWSDVQSTLPPLPISTSAADRVPRKHRPTRTSRDGGGEREKDTQSGSKHGSTAASTVVARGARHIAQTNDQDNEAATLTSTTGDRPQSPLSLIR